MSDPKTYTVPPQPKVEVKKTPKINLNLFKYIITHFLFLNEKLI